MRILLVEDCGAYSKAIRNANSSHEIMVARTLKEAHQYMAQNPALVFADLSLPDSEGLATLAALMRYGRPCVVLTANPDLACEAARMGAIDYITKDDSERLMRRVSFNIERFAPKRRLSNEILEQIKGYVKCPEWRELIPAS